MTVLTTRALNRALLARQLLLERHDLPVPAAIEHLVGLQAQEPRDPHVALWSRLRDDPRPAIDGLLTERSHVRAATLRTTLHLQSAADHLATAPLTAPLMARTFWATAWGKDLRAGDVDVDALLTAGRDLLAASPRTRRELADALSPAWPDRDPAALAMAVTYLLPVVQVPPRGLWGRSHQATWASAETWLADVPAPDPAGLLRRYLAAFGPATVSDARTWSGINGLREVAEGLRDELRTFTDERGRELLDLPDAPLPDRDTPAPPRFLPTFDNVLLSHDDRSRVGVAGPQEVAPGRGGANGWLLVDGMLAATWRATTGRAAVLDVHPSRRLTADEEEAVADEGDRLLVFLTGPGAAPADRDVRLQPPP